MNRIAMLHLAARRSQLPSDGPLAAELRRLGELTIVEHGRELSDEQALAMMREADVLLTMWGARPIPPALAVDPGRVRYILNLTGTCREFIPVELIKSAIPVTNWGDAPARVVAEGAAALLLAVLKDLRPRAENIASGQWGAIGQMGLTSGSMHGLRIGLYGCGAIGRRFVELVAPFEPAFGVFDPFAAELPAACMRVPTLAALFEQSEAIVIWAGLNDQTRGSVNAALLAKLPDHGIVINAARGDIIDQDALFAELKSGRLRAGLDVLAGNDSLPPNHEARSWPNLLLTCHDVASSKWPVRTPSLSDADKIALDNLQRFLDGRPLRFVMDERRYHLSS
jgi:phosphoglycerate dehydrogenase-like enzyme